LPTGWHLFCGAEATEGEIFWVDLGVIEPFRP